MSRRSYLGLAIVASTALAGAQLLAACAQAPPPNVVLITLDTTRADRLGAYGFAGAHTPNLDRFAAGAVLYEVAYSTSSWTLPSHASLFTGLLPMQHGAQTAPDGPSHALGYTVRPLAEHFTTLAEHLAAVGYRTAAVVAGPALRSELGLAQGFETYDDQLRGQGEIWNGRRAEAVANRAIALVERLSAGRAPFFLFVNFFDPHAPYRPPPPDDAGLAPIEDAPLVLSLVERLRAAAPGRGPDELEPWERTTLDAMRAGYDAELAYMDRHLGRLLAALERSTAGDALWIAITSDHGESFGEHNYLSHGAHLYEDNVRVPLLIRYPPGRGPAAGTRVSEPVQNHWLFGAILDAAGLTPPAGRPPGSLAASGAADGDGVIVTEVLRSDNNVSLFGEVFDRDLRALYAPPWKLIQSSTGQLQLFDLSGDAGESTSLAEAEADRRRAMVAQLERISRHNPPLFDAGDRVDLSPETEEALRALGYLE